jgi:hypothetical protein
MKILCIAKFKFASEFCQTGCLLALPVHSVEYPGVKRSKTNSNRARNRVLAQWRGVDYAPLETARATPARLPGDILPGLMKELRLDARQAEAEVVKVWNSLIDPAVTAHAQPANLHKGTLFVNVDNSVWLTEIVRYRRREILERLQHSFGSSVVKKLSFRIG